MESKEMTPALADDRRRFKELSSTWFGNWDVEFRTNVLFMLSRIVQGLLKDQRVKQQARRFRRKLK